MDLTFKLDEQLNITKHETKIKPRTFTKNGTYDVSKPCFLRVGEKIDLKEKIDLEGFKAMVIAEDPNVWCEDNYFSVCYEEVNGEYVEQEMYLWRYGDEELTLSVYVYDNETDENFSYIYADEKVIEAWGLEDGEGWYKWEYDDEGNENLVRAPAPRVVILDEGYYNNEADLWIRVLGKFVYAGNPYEETFDAVNPVTVKVSRYKDLIEAKGGAIAGLFQNCTETDFSKILDYDDTSNVTNFEDMFIWRISISGGFQTKSCPIEIAPSFSVEGAYSLKYLFNSCNRLVEAPALKTSHISIMRYMFSDCSSLVRVYPYDTSHVYDVYGMFSHCTSLEVVPALDLRSVNNSSNASNFVNYCTNLKEIWVKNIRQSMTVGSGTTYGHLLTLESLIHLIGELRNYGGSHTLTVGSANLTKLENLYVRTIEITDEMREEDDLIDEKLPFEVCESTDEGALWYQDYMLLKKWTIK